MQKNAAQSALQQIHNVHKGNNMHIQIDIKET